MLLYIMNKNLNLGEYMNNTLEKTNYQSIEINSVLKNTYLLLGATLCFSAFASWIAVQMNVPMMNPFIMLGVYFLLLFLVHKTANSSLGILVTFAFTGWLGFTLGPVLSHYLTIPGGDKIIAQALGGTALLFFSLSGYVVIKKPDMSKALPFIAIGLLVAFVMSLVNFFFLNMPLLSVVVSAVFLILSSALLMWQTSAIVNGGEKNYIMATITIFVSLYNIFVSLLQLFSFFGGDD